MYNNFHGEIQDGKHVDEILREYFPVYDYKGNFFDVGAFEPIIISNSYHFEKNGWNVYCFEANPSSVEKLQKERKNVFNYAVYDKDSDKATFNVVLSNGWTAGFSAIELSDAVSKVFPCDNKEITQIQVKQKTLNNILKNDLNDAILQIDILKIDVEGGELKVLKGLDINKYNPKIILVENIDNNKNIYDYLTSFGYVLDKHISYNQYYVKNKFIGEDMNILQQ
jgi:FkbM family methyltransferase